MALSDIPGTPGNFKQTYVDISGTTNAVTLLSAQTGKRQCVWSFMASADTSCILTLKTGTEILFKFHIPSNWGLVKFFSVKLPVFVTEEGADLTITSDTSINSGGVHLVYSY